MGKKGKRSTKTGDGKPKQGPGKARRERAAAMKEIMSGVAALVERLESETKDTELFGPLPEQEECPICFLPLPRMNAEQVYMPCCGQTLCGGCTQSSFFISGVKSVICAFCRSESRQGDAFDVNIAQYRGRAEKNDAKAIKALAENYRDGEYGLPKDEAMALRLFLRAAELGNLNSIVDLATHFQAEDPQDAVFARKLKLAAIAAKKGDLASYILLGFLYHEQRDVENAVKSWTFAARAGNRESMEFLRNYKVNGVKAVSDDDFEAIEEAQKDAAKQEWSEEREIFKRMVME